MDSEIATPPATQPVRGYQRAAVDEFLAAAAAERSRLEALIAEADDRADRARAAVGMHQVMVSMLVETQEELTRRRRAADQEAREIILAAEARALAIEQAPVALSTPEPVAAPAPAPAAAPAVAPAAPASSVGFEMPPVPEPVTIAATQVAPQPVSPEAEAAALAPRLQSNGHDDEEADRFFAFLRRALEDDEPLGPRPEPPA